MGFGLESDAIHSPNENFSLDIFRKGIEAVVRIPSQLLINNKNECGNNL